MEVKSKLSEEVYNNLFVTSDTHFNHNKEFVYKARGYDNPTVMTDDMINIINSTVGENGYLLHLGDFCLNTNIDEYFNILSRLKIKELWMVSGNHNNPHNKIISKELYGHYTIKNLGDYFTFRYGKKEFICFHFPILVWDNMHNGSMHLCGHSHHSLDISRPSNTEKKILDVGWDGYSKPLSMKEIEDIMSTKGVVKLDHH